MGADDDGVLVSTGVNSGNKFSTVGADACICGNDAEVDAVDGAAGGAVNGNIVVVVVVVVVLAPPVKPFRLLSLLVPCLLLDTLFNDR